ncbi:hypothetical protein PAMP_012303 [Pampus punctatissimus]
MREKMREEHTVKWRNPSHDQISSLKKSEREGDRESGALARLLATMRTDFALVLTAALLLDSFWRSNGEHASKGPCRPGFSQSFYSVLIPRDLLQGQDVLKVKSLAQQGVSTQSETITE